MRRAALPVTLICGLAGCGDDSAAATGTDGSSSGGLLESSSGQPPESTTGSGSTGQPGDDSGSTADSSREDSTGRDGSSSSDGTTGEPLEEEIVVHTAAAGQPVVWNAADGSLLGWTTSDDDASAVVPSSDAAAVAMVSSLDGGQWTTLNGVAPGDELWLTWRGFPDTEQLGELRVVLPSPKEHPTAGDVGFTQLSIGCGDSLVGVPPDQSEAVLPIDATCVPASGLLNLVAYAQGGPQISVVGVAEVSGIAWAAGESTDVLLTGWTPDPPEVLFTTTDPLANPVVNTTHSQWIEGVKFPMPRRSGSPGTRLFAAPALAEQLQYTGFTDLGVGDPPPSRMFFGERTSLPDDGTHDIPISDLLLPEISSTTAAQIDGRWQLSLQSPRGFSGTDAILLQSRWLGGFWAFMAPPAQTTVVVPDLPPELQAEGLGEGDSLDTPFAVVVDVDSLADYDAFRPRGAYFFSGPDVLPGEEESFVRGAIYFPVPF